ncbi:MAG: DNA methyltransferase [Planctomycetota bacterium]
MTTTLWEYPSQHYDGPKSGPVQGSARYTGATPSWVIWQVMQMHSRPGQRVIDPMCGSGTTLDVAKDLGRAARGFDLVPSRDDVEQADARDLPVDDSSTDLVFIDPPYSTHIDYSDDPDCIGKLDALGPDGGAAYFDAMGAVLAEGGRVLRPGGALAIYVSDTWRPTKGEHRGGFSPIGLELYAIARSLGFSPIDHVAVVRKNRKLSRGNFHKAADEHGFLLRGFNHLLLLRSRD